MDFKQYTKKWFGIEMSDLEVNELERYLIQNASNIQNLTELKSYIRNYIISKYKGRRLRIISEADNSDLEQMLRLIKAKADKK